jgi:CheY-like chemotaxis protein
MPQTDAAPETVPRTVLIVDDDVLIRLVLCGVLRDTGLRVIEAGNAEEALTFLRTGSPVDLVFTDVRMPGPLDGAGLARLMRTEFPSIKVIKTSGDVQPKDAEPGVPLIEKPYALRQVVSIILATLDQLPVSTTS